MTLRVLLVEDDPNYARLVKECLAEHGDAPALTIAATLALACAAIESAQPHVVLLDLGLPDADGLEAVDRLRKVAPRTPLVVLSGENDLDTAIAAIRLGAREYLVKGESEQVLLPRAIRYAIERERMAQFEQLLLGVVGHDLRTPLQTISMAREVLVHETMTEDGRTALEMLSRGIRRATTLVHDILDFTRLRSSGLMALERAPTELGEIVQSIVREQGSAHPRRTIEVRGDEVIRGWWDRARVEQIVANLLGNALQHSPSGSTVTVELRHEGDTAHLAIHNVGVPIPAASLPRLFEPLTRAAERRSGGERSVGLGLYIVEQAVLAHGGTIEVSSNASEGTRFVVRLPKQR